MLSKSQVQHCLASIKQIKKSHVLYDIHVHPFEVIFNDLKYIEDSHSEGLYRATAAIYTPPQVGDLKLTPEAGREAQTIHDDNQMRKYCLLTMRRLYLHTGPRVFTEQMTLSGVDRMLLLPVSGTNVDSEMQMAQMAGMFGDDHRFALGYALPSGKANDQIEAAIAAAVHRYDVRAVKIHPAIDGINVGHRCGIERVECILRACRAHGLSLVIHGGRSPVVRDVAHRSYGELDRLAAVDWSLAGNFVVIAHAGLYGCDEGVQQYSLLSLLRSIMSRHENVLADVSGVRFASLCRLLETIDPGRLVFGSDSLYHPQWQTIVRLYLALRQTVPRFEEHFVRITSTNPAKIIGGRTHAYHDTCAI